MHARKSTHAVLLSTCNHLCLECCTSTVSIYSEAPCITCHGQLHDVYAPCLPVSTSHDALHYMPDHLHDGQGSALHLHIPGSTHDQLHDGHAPRLQHKYFPSNLGHAVLGLEAGCTFVAGYDDGDFDEPTTALGLGNWLTTAPPKIVAQVRCLPAIPRSCASQSRS